MRIPFLAGFLIFAACVGLAAASALVLIVALNGFSERRATVALVVFALGALLALAFSPVAGFLACRRLREIGWRPVSAVLLPLALFTALDTVAVIVFFLAAVLAAEHWR